MIKTKLKKLSYKVKNKKTTINQFYKRKILTTGFAIVQKGKNKTKTPNARQSNNHNKSVNGDWVNSPQGRSNTHDPFQYSIISVF